PSAGITRCLSLQFPLCRDPFAAHHEHMRQMMRSFSEPFGRDLFPSLPEGGERAAERKAERGAQQGSHVAVRGSRRVNFGDPFSAMDRMMSNMRNNMLEMHRKFDDLSIQPNGHSFSSSSMMTYSKVGDGPPKVFQASTQTHTAPGGVKETRKALKDSESGLEKMAIGHHIQDQAHVIRKSRNSKTGDEELNQEFINMDESEADTFDEEWQKEIMKFRPCRSRGAVEASRSRSVR
ncbi:MLF1 factor, partial [Picathartes gymnocephalus]|nr:MLF1 factor [Picathartes gymnocephalus]